MISRACVIYDEPRLIAEKLGNGCAINGMTLGADGRLYGAQPTDDRFVRVDIESGVTPAR